MKQTLDVGDSTSRRRQRSQAQRLGSTPTFEQRPLQRGQWIGLGVAALAAVALTAGLVFLVLTLTRPNEPRPLAVSTPQSQVSASPTPLPVALIFATPTPPVPVIATAAPRGERLQIANTEGQGANLRRDASTTAEKIRVLPDGTVVEVVGADRSADGFTWRNVRDFDGETGWIPSNFLVAEGSAPAPSTSQAPPQTIEQPGAASTPRASTGSTGRNQIGNTGGQGANIRSEPGAAGRVLKTIPEGATVESTGQQREVDGRLWRQIRDSAGVTGWVTAGALVPPGTVATPPPPGSRPAPTSAPSSTSPSGPSDSGSGTQPTSTPRPSGTLAPLPAPPSLFNPTPSSKPTSGTSTAPRTPTPRP